MGVGKGNVEVVNICHLFLIFIHNTPPGESTAAAIPALPLKTDSDSPPFSRVTLGFFSPIPAPALLVLQDLLTPDFWCPTGEVTLLYGRGEGVHRNGWKGGWQKLLVRYSHARVLPVVL